MSRLPLERAEIRSQVRGESQLLLTDQTSFLYSVLVNLIPQTGTFDSIYAFWS